MSDETTAPEADPSELDVSVAPADGPSAVLSNVTEDTEVAAEDAPAPEAELDAPEEPEAETEPEPEPAPAEPVEEEAPEGGWLGDHVRKAVADVRTLEAVFEGKSRITREHLAEIALRRAQADLPTLLAACSRLLDELEGVK